MCQKIDGKAFVWGVTGGIGSGKSRVCRLLEGRGWPVFYCDDEAKRLMRMDAALRSRLAEVVGEGLYRPDGTLDKAVMAAFLCAGPPQSARVDAVVHPRVADAFREWVGRQRSTVVVMECALLFESGFDRLVDRSVLVYADKGTRVRRVVDRDGVTAAQAEAWMALQMDEEEKRRRAHCVLYNGDGGSLEDEVARIFGELSFSRA